MSWEICTVNNNYEIFSEYPHQIRKISSKRIIQEHIDKNGYISCHLNIKSYKKHYIVASQWIINDDPQHKTEIDHINHIRDDNHINNLRWVLKTQNCRNKKSYNNIEAIYLNELPKNCIKIELYKGILFEHYYYCQDNCKCYYDNGVLIRELIYHKAPSGLEYIRARDIENKTRCIYIKAWLREECIE